MTGDAQIGEVTDPDFVRLPDPATMFGVRAQRLKALAPASLIGPYLIFLSEIVAIQHAAPRALRPPNALALHAEPGFPLISAASLRQDPGLGETLTWFAETAHIGHAPVEAERARERVRAMAAAERLALALSIFEAAYPVEQLGEALYVAAALQLYLTRQAALLNPGAVQPVADGVCPVCGAGPVASVIVGWAKAARARYCCCSLCGTMWNHVRIKCTACGATTGVGYFLLQGGSKESAVETCTICGSYIKHLHHHRNAQIEAFADDLNTFPLDLLAEEKHFHRIAANPLMPVRPSERS